MGPLIPGGSVGRLRAGENRRAYAGSAEEPDDRPEDSLAELPELASRSDPPPESDPELDPLADAALLSAAAPLLAAPSDVEDSPAWLLWDAGAG